MKPGDLVLLPIPNFASDGPEAHPALVLGVGPTGWNEDEVVLVAHITSDLDTFENPRAGDIPVYEWEAWGLDYECTIRCRQISSIPSRYVRIRLGQVDLVTLLTAQREAGALFPDVWGPPAG